MRAEKSGPTSEHPQPALVVRASLPRTFLGLGLCLEAGLLACGGYLVEQALREPLHADQTAVLAGGVILSFAGVLLFYLVRPQRRDVLARTDHEQPFCETSAPPPAFEENLPLERP